MCRTVWPGVGTVGDLKIYFILHDDVLHCSSEKKKSQHRFKRWTRKKKHEKFPTGRESSRDDGRGKKDESSSRLRVKEKVIHIQNLYS